MTNGDAGRPSQPYATYGGPTRREADASGELLNHFGDARQDSERAGAGLFSQPNEELDTSTSVRSGREQETGCRSRERTSTGGQKRRASSSGGTLAVRRRLDADPLATRTLDVVEVAPSEAVFDEDYDVTPGLGQRRLPKNSPLQRQQDVPTLEQQHTSDRMQEPPSGHPSLAQNLKVRFKLRDYEGISVVSFTKNTTVQQAFAAVGTRFARKLQGASVQALRFAFPDGDILDVELDDGDTWEMTMLKLTQLSVQGDLSAVHAVVEI